MAEALYYSAKQEMRTGVMFSLWRHKSLLKLLASDDDVSRRAGVERFVSWNSARTNSFLSTLQGERGCLAARTLVDASGELNEQQQLLLLRTALRLDEVASQQGRSTVTESGRPWVTYGHGLHRDLVRKTGSMGKQHLLIVASEVRGRSLDWVMQALDEEHHTRLPEDALFRSLADEDLQVRIRVIGQLGESGNPKVGKALLPLLRHSEHQVRVAATLALSKAHCREAIPVLLENVVDQTVPVRKAAIVALGELQAVEAIPRMLQLVREGKISREAVYEQFLAVLESDDAVQALETALREETGSVAASALGRSVHSRASAVLARVLGIIQPGDKRVNSIEFALVRRALRRQDRDAKSVLRSLIRTSSQKANVIEAALMLEASSDMMAASCRTVTTPQSMVTPLDGAELWAELAAIDERCVCGIATEVSPGLTSVFDLLSEANRMLVKTGALHPEDAVPAFAYLKDSEKNLVGLWLQEPSMARDPAYVTTLLLRGGADSSIMNRTRRVVPNKVNSQRGCFVLFGSESVAEGPLDSSPIQELTRAETSAKDAEPSRASKDNPTTRSIESVLLFLIDLSGQWRFYKRDGALVYVDPPRRLLQESDQALGLSGELLRWIEQRGCVQRFEEIETIELFRDFVGYEFPGRELLFRHGRTETIGYNLVVVVAPTGALVEQPMRRVGQPCTNKKILILYDKTQTLVICEKCDISEPELNFLFKANPRFAGPDSHVKTLNCPLAFGRHDHLQLAISIANRADMRFDPGSAKLKSISLPDLGTLALAWAGIPK